MTITVALIVTQQHITTGDYVDAARAIVVAGYENDGGFLDHHRHVGSICCD
jgi:hypothetical protein